LEERVVGVVVVILVMGQQLMEEEVQEVQEVNIRVVGVVVGLINLLLEDQAALA